MGKRRSILTQVPDTKHDEPWRREFQPITFPCRHKNCQMTLPSWSTWELKSTVVRFNNWNALVNTMLENQPRWESVSIPVSDRVAFRQVPRNSARPTSVDPAVPLE